MNLSFDCIHISNRTLTPLVHLAINCDNRLKEMIHFFIFIFHSYSLFSLVLRTHHTSHSHHPAAPPAPPHDQDPMELDKPRGNAAADPGATKPADISKCTSSEMAENMPRLSSVSQRSKSDSTANGTRIVDHKSNGKSTNEEVDRDNVSNKGSISLSSEKPTTSLLLPPSDKCGLGAGEMGKWRRKSPPAATGGSALSHGPSAVPVDLHEVTTGSVCTGRVQHTVSSLPEAKVTESCKLHQAVSLDVPISRGSSPLLTITRDGKGNSTEC